MHIKQSFWSNGHIRWKYPCCWCQNCKKCNSLSLYIAFLLCNALQSAVLASIKCECLSQSGNVSKSWNLSLSCQGCVFGIAKIATDSSSNMASNNFRWIRISFATLPIVLWNVNTNTPSVEWCYCFRITFAFILQNITWW